MEWIFRTKGQMVSLHKVFATLDAAALQLEVLLLLCVLNPVDPKLEEKAKLVTTWRSSSRFFRMKNEP